MKQFFLHFIPGGSESINAGATTMCALGGSSVETDLVGERNTRRFHQAGTLSLLTVNVTVNSLSSTATWKTAIGTTGSTDGNLIVTYSAAQTGALDDDSNTDDIAADDVYTFEVAAASGTGSITWERAGGLWGSDTGSISLLGSNSASSFSLPGAGSTLYMIVAGSRVSNSNEDRAQNYLSSAGTWRYLAVGIATLNMTTLVADLTSRIDGVDGNMTIAIDENDSNAYLVDESNTDAVVSGNTLGIDATTTTFVGSGTNIEWFPSQINHTGDETVVMTSGSRETLATSTDYYFSVAGQLNATTTEADAEVNILMDATASKLGCAVSQSTATLTGTLRINAADGNQVATLTAVSRAIDESNTDDLLAADDVAIHVVKTAGSGRFQATSLVLAPTAGGITATGDLDAQASALSGAAIKTLLATGALPSQASALSANAIKTLVSSGALQAQSAQVDGSAVIAGAVVATGDLQAQASDVSGAATKSVKATGTPQAQAAEVAAQAIKTVKAAGVPAAQASRLSGLAIGPASGGGAGGADFRRRRRR